MDLILSMKLKALVSNTFCPTGEGGGVDPSCSLESSGDSSSWKPGQWDGGKFHPAYIDSGVYHDGHWDHPPVIPEDRALVRYAKYGHYANMILAGRGNELSNAQQDVWKNSLPDLKSALDKSVLSKKMTLYSGIGKDESDRMDLSNLKPGDVIEYTTPQSTSVSKKVAVGFASTHGKRDVGSYVAKITAHTGTKGIDMQSYSEYSEEEKEFLLAPTKYRVRSSRENVIELETVK